MADWNSASPTLPVHTSGSTGTPKLMQVEKARMAASARMTCRFLGLKAGDTALLCMSLDYIAGKMMVVRSIVGQLKLIAVRPCGHPLRELSQYPEEGYDFAAMVPLQVYNSLQTQEERRRLKSIRQLIIGGGAIDTTMGEELKTFPGAVWSTYGMTETLSHIALRRLSGPQSSQWYCPMDGVTLSLTPETHQLVVDAPALCPCALTTNDVAELAADGRHFRILGRVDNIVDSGGIKIQIEEVEHLLAPCLQMPFMVTKRRDEKFGEILVLLTEDNDLTAVRAASESCLPKYWRPRDYLSVVRLPLTPNGKAARSEAERLAAAMSHEAAGTTNCKGDELC